MSKENRIFIKKISKIRVLIFLVVFFCGPMADTVRPSIRVTYVFNNMRLLLYVLYVPYTEYKVEITLKIKPTFQEKSCLHSNKNIVPSQLSRINDQRSKQFNEHIDIRNSPSVLNVK